MVLSIVVIARIQFRYSLVGFVIICSWLVLWFAGCATSPLDQSKRLEVPIPEQYDAHRDDRGFCNLAWLSDFEDPQLHRLRPQ